MVKVIIVEDDPMVSFINQKYVEKIEGMKVSKIFGDGKEALAYLKKENVDIVIMDLYMPKMTGLELLKEIRFRGLECEIIMVTAANDEESIKETMKFGILDYLVKPFTFDRFKEALNKYFAKYTILNKDKDLSQEDIDKMIYFDHDNNNLDKYQKGINTRTLEDIIAHLEKVKPDSLTSEELAKISGFSIVTVRRYMNYLKENNKVDSFINYQTGGRPSIHYFIKD